MIILSENVLLELINLLINERLMLILWVFLLAVSPKQFRDLGAQDFGQMHQLGRLEPSKFDHSSPSCVLSWYIAGQQDLHHFRNELSVPGGGLERDVQ